MKKLSLIPLLACLFFCFHVSCQKSDNSNDSSQIDSLKSSIRNLQARCDSLSNALELANTNNANLSQTVDSLKAQLASVTNQLSQLQSQLNTANANIAALNAEIATLNQKYADLLSQLNQLLLQFNIPPVSLAKDLVAWYPFTGNANDSSGFNNNGTVNGATLTTDRFGNANSAYQFDGASYIQVPFSSKLDLTNGTIAFWFKTNQSTLQIMINRTTYATAANEDYAVAMDGNNFVDFYVKYNSGCTTGIGWRRCTYPNNYSDGNYHHLAGTISSDSLRLYIDGNIVAYQAVPNPVADVCGPSPLYIGRDWATNQLYNFKGSIDDVRLYNRALTQQEIAYLAGH